MKLFALRQRTKAQYREQKRSVIMIVKSDLLSTRYDNNPMCFVCATRSALLRTIPATVFSIMDYVQNKNLRIF